jgi:hypothetical protein
MNGMHDKRESGRFGVALLAVAVACGCGEKTGPRLEDALAVALAPEHPPQVWMVKLPGLNDGEHGKRELRQAMGRNNFTSWLLTCPAEASAPLYSGDFEWRLTPNPHLMSSYLSHYDSLLSADNIYELVWEYTPGNAVRGSFQARTPYGLRAKFLFEGNTSSGILRIHKLAVAKKYSIYMMDAFPIVAR